MDETTQEPEVVHRESRIARFGRRHPMLTVAAVAAAGLTGGMELAAGVVLGAGVAALLRRSPGAPPSEAPGQPSARMHELRRELEDRARAVIRAARGETQAPAH